jgi:hypothetical protein
LTAALADARFASRVAALIVALDEELPEALSLDWLSWVACVLVPLVAPPSPLPLVLVDRVVAVPVLVDGVLVRVVLVGAVDAGVVLAGVVLAGAALLGVVPIGVVLAGGLVVSVEVPGPT